MKTVTECPQPEELRRLLDGSLPADEQRDYLTHLEACPPCQRKLEDIATAGSNLSQVVQHIDRDEPVATSAFWPALHSLDSSAEQTIVPLSGNSSSDSVSRSGTRNRDLSLSFLQPPSDAAYLGRMAHFDVMRIIGRGGMGVVLEAFDSKLQRHVAIKVLDPELAHDEIARQRFCREARAAASITHENVVAVHQVERSGEEGLPYLVMQLISGESLEDRLLRERKLPHREIVRIGMQAAQGLAAAHSQGLIHRDIKPGNIMLESAQGNVKLTDFGLARVADDVRLTRTGAVSGTPLYMAPEQAMGEEPDQRSDLFSLGTILYEMCSGQPPFVGNSALAILKQIVDTKHRPLKELAPEVPQWLADTVDRLLAKKPADRIQSAAHLAELFEFEWALMKTTSEEVPTVCQEEHHRITVRNRWIGLAIGLSFLTLGLLGGYLLSGRGSSVASPAAILPLVSSAEPVAVLSANSGAIWAESFDPRGKWLLMGVEDGTARLWDLPARAVKSTFNAHQGTIWTTSFSHSGEQFATGGDDGLLKLWKPGEAEPLQSFEHPSAVRSVVFSHDDKKLFAGDRKGGIRVWSPGSPEPLRQAEQPGTIYALVVSPDDQTLATAGSDKVVRLWNAETLTTRLPLEGHTGPIYSLSFSGDGKQLASVGWDKIVRIWDTASGTLLKSWDGEGGDLWGAAFSPVAPRLATAGHDGNVKLWDAETGKLLATFVGHKMAIHSLAFSADGKQLASGGRDGAVRIWPIND